MTEGGEEREGEGERVGEKTKALILEDPKVGREGKREGERERERDA